MIHETLPSLGIGMVDNLLEHQEITVVVCECSCTYTSLKNITALIRYSEMILLLSTGAIEVSITTMRKAERSTTDEVYVCGFVPSYQLPKKRSCALDPFIFPLIEEIKDSFINGMRFVT